MKCGQKKPLLLSSGLVLSREWSLAWILLLDNEITREMDDKDKENKQCNNYETEAEDLEG